MEVSDLRSAGILQAHGINTLIGSDVQNWDKYPKNKLLNNYFLFVNLLLDLMYYIKNVF